MILARRSALGRYSEVLPLWEGKTAVILGGGPSLTLEQVAYVAAKREESDMVRCIAVNDAYLLAPWCDTQYAADLKWHAWHTAGVPRPGLSAEEVRQRWASFAGQKCTIEDRLGRFPEDESVHVLRNATHPSHGMGLSFSPCALITGRNSGHQSLNLAVLAGAKKILLLGFDAKTGATKSHWFGEHPEAAPPASYEYFRRAASAAEEPLRKAGVAVINCSPDSAIDSFPRAAIADVL